MSVAFSGPDSRSLQVDEYGYWVIEPRIEIVDMANNLQVAVVISVRHVEPRDIHSSLCQFFDTFC